MTELAYKFPRSLEAKLFDSSSHGRLWLAMASISLVLVPLVIYLSQLPPAEVTTAEREKYLRVIYRVPPTSQTLVEGGASGVESPVEGFKEEISRVLRGESVQERAERRQEQAQARKQRREQRLDKIRSVGIFTVAGVQMPSLNGQRSSALTLAGGSLEGIVARTLEELSSRPDESALAKLRAEGIIKNGIGEVEASRYELPEIEIALSQATVELDALPKVRSRVSADRARAPEVINEIIELEIPRLRECYLTQKRKDKRLKGSLLVKCVIGADGKVSRVRLRNSRWSNPALGKRVERCLQQKISLWKFDSVKDAKDTPIEFPLLFS